MIKAIIFDFGDVIYQERWDLVLQGLQKIDKRITLEEFKIAFARRWNDYEIGLLERAVFWSDVLTNLDLRNSQNNIFKISSSFSRIWEDHNELIIKIIKKLRKNYLIFGLTNSCFENEDRLNNDKKVSGLFKKIYMSHKEQKKKPDREAYLNVLEENNLLAEECIFIDDKQRNIRISQSLGIHSLKYESPQQLKKELKKLGCLI